jgi:ketosteroid isomerase-like protein
MKALGKLARSFLLPAAAGIIGWSLLSAPLFVPQLFAQKNKKPDDSSGASLGLPALPVPDAQAIDHDIGEMLGAFQVGNIEAMHKYYSDNATFVRGTFDPPLVGWVNYVKMYQQQRAAFPGMQVIRRNTSIFVHADVSWVSYQWQFESSFNGKPFSARGQTTLVLNKAGDNWLIVHNHTSQICPETAAPATAPTAGH